MLLTGIITNKNKTKKNAIFEMFYWLSEMNILVLKGQQECFLDWSVIVSKLSGTVEDSSINLSHLVQSGFHH